MVTPALSWDRVLLVLSFSRHSVFGRGLKPRNRAGTGDAERGDLGVVPNIRMHRLMGGQADGCCLPGWAK